MLDEVFGDEVVDGVQVLLPQISSFQRRAYSLFSSSVVAMSPPSVAPSPTDRLLPPLVTLSAGLPYASVRVNYYHELAVLIGHRKNSSAILRPPFQVVITRIIIKEVGGVKRCDLSARVGARDERSPRGRDHHDQQG